MSTTKTEELPFFHPDRREKRKDQRKYNRENRRNKRKVRRGQRNEFNIDKLRYNFDQGARANRYLVGIYCPVLGIKMDGVRCVSATIPGRQLETTDFSEYGPTRKMPFNVNYNGGEVALTFLCDSTFVDRFILDAWQGAIFAGAGHGDYSGTANHPVFSYYNEYVGTMEIEQYNQTAMPSTLFKLQEVYPLNINAQELSYENGEILKVEVTFAFRYFQTEYKNPNTVRGINRGRRALDLLLDIKNLQPGGNKANDTVQRFRDQLNKFSGFFSGKNKTNIPNLPGNPSDSGT